MAHSGQVCNDFPARPFSPGLSIQPAFDCSDVTCELRSCTQPDLAVAMGRLRTDNWIRSWIITQLLTQARVPDKCVLPSGSDSPRGWWADSFRKSDFVSGSLLWTLSFNRGIAESVQFSRLYAISALTPLREWGIVEKIEVTSRYLGQGTLSLNVEVFGPSRREPVSVTLSGISLPSMSWLWSAP